MTVRGWVPQKREKKTAAKRGNGIEKKKENVYFSPVFIGG